MATPPSLTTTDTSTDNQSILILTLVGDKGEEVQHVVVPFPKSYKDAETLAIQHLGKYMQSNSPKIILRRSLKNRKGEWIWADIPPDDWKSTVIASAEVGVFLLNKQTPFVHGPLYLVQTDDDGAGISWPKVQLHQFPDAGAYGGIARPKSYEEAVNSVCKKFNIKDRASLTFCTFTNIISQKGELLDWIPIPDHVCQNDAEWQRMMPLPGGILGVITKKPSI